MTKNATALAALGVAMLLSSGRATCADELQAGLALFREGKFAEAEGQFRGASGAEAQAWLAAALAKQKKYGEAETAAKAVVEGNAAHEVAAPALGEALVGQKKYDEAADKMSAAIKARTDLAYAYYWRGQAYYNKKQPDRMVSDFETFLKLAPKAPEAPTVQQLLSSLR
jgi:tetratricopeptide (TPR) repeat protein